MCLADVGDTCATRTIQWGTALDLSCGPCCARSTARWPQTWANTTWACMCVHPSVSQNVYHPLYSDGTSYPCNIDVVMKSDRSGSLPNTAVGCGMPFVLRVFCWHDVCWELLESAKIMNLHYWVCEGTELAKGHPNCIPNSCLINKQVNFWLENNETCQQKNIHFAHGLEAQEHFPCFCTFCTVHMSLVFCAILKATHTYEHVQCYWNVVPLTPLSPL